MKNNWPIKKLGDVAYLVGGFAFESTKLKKEPTNENYYPVVKIGNLKNGALNSNNASYYKMSENLNKYLIEKDDILIAMTGATVGKAAISKFNKLLLNQRVGLVRNKEEISQGYLSYILCQKTFYDFCQIAAGGGAQGNISPTQILSYEIPIPPLKIQQKIVERLEAIRKAQDLNDLQISKTQELFESILNKIGDKQNYKIETFNNHSLVQIIDGDRGRNYPHKNEFAESGYCVFLNTKNVTMNGFSFDNINYISKEKDDLLRKGKMQKNDIVLTTRGTVGNSMLYDDSVLYDQVRINSGMIIMRPNTEVLLPYFLWNIIKSNKIQDQFKQIVSGSAQPQLPISNLVNVKFILPPFSDQQKIVKKLNAVQNYKKSFLKQKELLKELFDSVLDKSMNGELS